MKNALDFNPSLYHKTPQMVLGFHGCDKSTALKILNSHSEHLSPSENQYDWLGSGIYFWLNDPLRAYEWAVQSHKRNPDKIKHPFVIGAVIDLRLCLNLCERESIKLLQYAYSSFKQITESQGKEFNYSNRIPDSGGFNLIRPLDCAVINHLHKIMSADGISFDTVYGYFQEGRDAYEGAGIKEKSHIQVCVRNTDCIKGYFLPRI